jgi:hypothetical protein
VTVVDLKTRKILSTYSVEVFDEMPTNDVSRSIDDQHPWPNNRFEIAKGPGPAQVLLAGICSTPAVWDDKILIGTVSGKFCVLEDGSKPAG